MIVRNYSVLRYSLYFQHTKSKNMADVTFVTLLKDLRKIY